MEIKIIIEKSSDCFSAYAENIEGIYGMGDTLNEVKESILEAIEIQKEYKDNAPKELMNDYSLRFVFDIQSFLSFYDKVFSRSALSRLTGINEKQLGHYIQGLHKPRKDKVEKIESAIHSLGEELLSVELV